jgi:hypothetical protein
MLSQSGRQQMAAIEENGGPGHSNQCRPRPGPVNVQVLGLAAAVRNGRSRFGGGRGVAVVAERGFGDDPGL